MGHDPKSHECSEGKLHRIFQHFKDAWLEKPPRRPSPEELCIDASECLDCVRAKYPSRPLDLRRFDTRWYSSRTSSGVAVAAGFVNKAINVLVSIGNHNQQR